MKHEWYITKTGGKQEDWFKTDPWLKTDTTGL